MPEAEKRYLLEFLARLTPALAEAIGKNCEVVLHDLGKPESSIIAIANGNITGRKVGDTIDILGLQLLRHPPAGDFLNYQTRTKGGKVLRSSSVFLRDETGELFGALCVNHDISGLVMLQEWLQENLQAQQKGLQEGFEHTVDEVLDGLIQTAIRSTGKETGELTRVDKIAIIAHLEAKGAFLIRHSADRIAEMLNLSKFTIYNYLEEIKTRQSDNSAAGLKPVGAETAGALPKDQK